MSEHTALRGMNLGAQSFESTQGIVFAPRTQAQYMCDKGHLFAIPLSAEATPPLTWDCKCTCTGYLVGADEVVSSQKKPVRTHWDMLLERRTIAELEELLDERLRLLRAGELSGAEALRRSA